MQALTKDFWKKLQLECPEGMKLFTAWLVTYKSQHNWDKLFGNGIAFLKPPGIDFFDLPCDMQIGIWMHFRIYMVGTLYSPKTYYLHHETDIADFIRDLHTEATD